MEGFTENSPRLSKSFGSCDRTIPPVIFSAGKRALNGWIKILSARILLMKWCVSRAILSWCHGSVGWEGQADLVARMRSIRRLVPRVFPFNISRNHVDQEIIKVREWIPHIGLIPKVIPLKLFLYMVPSSSADVTRALRGCFRGGFVYVSFNFVS